MPQYPTVHEPVVPERATSCLIPPPESRSVSPLRAHMLLMVKSFTAVLTTGCNQLSADFYLPVFGSPGTQGDATTEAL